MTDTLEAPAKTAPQMTPLKGGLTPYLMLSDASAAIDFYKRAFGAEEIGDRVKMEDGRLMNSRVDINGASLMLMDPMPEYGHPATQPPISGNLHLPVDDTDAWFERAVAAGCEVLMAPKVEFWGDRYAQVRDPFGVCWAFGSTPR
jgi:uncharacterized glyoxalase superfamily protein PhnB